MIGCDWSIYPFFDVFSFLRMKFGDPTFEVGVFACHPISSSPLSPLWFSVSVSTPRADRIWRNNASWWAGQAFRHWHFDTTSLNLIAGFWSPGAVDQWFWANSTCNHVFPTRFFQHVYSHLFPTCVLVHFEPCPRSMVGAGSLPTPCGTGWGGIVWLWCSGRSGPQQTIKNIPQGLISLEIGHTPRACLRSLSYYHLVRAWIVRPLLYKLYLEQSWMGYTRRGFATIMRLQTFYSSTCLHSLAPEWMLEEGRPIPNACCTGSVGC